MNKAIMALYTLTTENMIATPSYTEKMKALAKAKLAVLDELGQLAGENAAALLDAYTSLDSDREELRGQIIFEAALKLGIELGRLTLTA